MLEKYDPTTGASILDLQATICRVERVKALEDLPESIDRWEKKYNTYKTQVGEELYYLTRQNIFLQMLPGKLEARMRFQMHSREGRRLLHPPA